MVPDVEGEYVIGIVAEAMRVSAGPGPRPPLLRQTRANGIGFEITEKLAKAFRIKETGIETGRQINGTHA